MSIRTAKNNDISKIRDLVLSLSYYYLGDPSDDLPAWFSDTLTLSAFSGRITNPEFQNFIFEENDCIAGYISIQGGSHIYHLFVSAAFQRKGIARLLWQHAKNHSKANNFSVRSSIHAVPVYQRFGFVEAGPAGNKDGILYQPMELHHEY